MGYPGSIYSPATINNGETVDASHQNDPNTEITAIETALINGTISHDLTPSTSSTRSLGTSAKHWKELYVDAVQSTGNSTLGNVTVGNLTVTNLQVNGGSSGTSPNPVAARVRQTSNTVNSSGEVLVVFNFNEQVDVTTSAFHSTTTNPSRLTFPSTGWYAISGNARYDGTSGGGTHSANLQILLDTTHVLGSVGQTKANNEPGLSLSVSAIARISGSTQFVELRGVSTGTDASTWVAASSYSIVMTAAKL